jgi:hypothetical protein
MLFGNISGISSTSSVNVGASSDNIGGLVGGNFGGTVLNSGATTTVTADVYNNNVGGLIGYNSGQVSGGTFVGSVDTNLGANYVGGGIGWNDAGGTATGLNIQSLVSTGSYSTGVGGIVGLNGSNLQTNGPSASASVSNSSFSGTVTVGDNSFAVAGLAGWNSQWTTLGGATVQASLSNVTGTGLVASPANGGTTYIHYANQVGCDEVGGNCFGTAGQEVIAISPNNLTVTYGQAQNLTYGTSYSAPGGTPSGLESGDSSNVVQVSQSANQQNAGTSNISTTANINPNDALALLDYAVTVTQPPATITVLQKAVTISASGSQTYGGTNLNVSYTFTGLINGDTSNVISGYSYSTPATSSSNAGTYSITAVGGTASNYSIVDTGTTFVVNKATVTATANGSQTYGGTNVTVAYSLNGLVNGDTSGAVSGLSYTTPATSSSNVGTYGITAVGGTAQNYNVVDASGNYTVNPAQLTVSATGSQTYGGTNVVGPTPTFVGLVNGDTSGVVSGVSISNPVTASSNAGTYTLGVTGGTASNYTITDVNGTETVNQAPLTVGATGTQVYGSTPVVTYSYTGLVNGDTGPAAVTGLSYATTATPQSNVGTYTVASVGGTSTNYIVTNAGPGTLQVTPAPLLVSANDTTRTQGTNTPAFTASFSGLVNGDGSSVVTGLVFTPGDTSLLGQGTYVNLIGVSGGVAQNYTLTYADGTLTVAAPGVTTPTVTNQIAGLNSLLQTFGTTLSSGGTQVTCLKVNSEVRGVTTDSPIDCAAPLQVNGF